MSAELDGLRAAASAATPGPWGVSVKRGFDNTSRVVKGDVVIAHYVKQTDRAFIAAASPDVVLALLDEVERLQGLLRGGDREAYDDAEKAEERAEYAEGVLARVQALIKRGDVRTLDDSEESCVMICDLTAALEAASDDAGSPVRPADGLSGPAHE